MEAKGEGTPQSSADVASVLNEEEIEELGQSGLHIVCGAAAPVEEFGVASSSSWSLDFKLKEEDSLIVRVKTLQNNCNVIMQPDEIEQAVFTNINQKLTELSMTQSKCTIYRVHEHLRNINSKAYEPQVIAIGPYHRDKGNLKMMEDHKVRYFHSLLKERKYNLAKFASVIAPLESKARKCYAEPVRLTPTKFVEMLVIDGCFIIQLVKKKIWEQFADKNDPVLDMDWIMNSLQRDLMLFENQIPFFILLELFDLIEGPNHHSSLVFQLLNFFCNLLPKTLNTAGTSKPPGEMKHLLDLIHSNWLPSLDFSNPGEVVEDTCLDFSNPGEVVEDEKMGWSFIKNATTLREANVKFEMNQGPEIKFEKGTMSLPSLIIEDRTESLFRNLIAYEQYFRNPQASFVMRYVKFLDCLIDSSRDVEILSRYGIIDNWLGDDDAVANIFNRLTDSVSGPLNSFIYAEIFDNVKKHCSRRRNKWMANLRRNYLNSPWAVISVLAGLVLLLLTVTQAVTSVLQVT